MATRETAFVIILPRRMLDEATVAAYLAFPSTAAFRAARPRLDAIGFPRPIAELGHAHDKALIDAWLDALGQDGLVFTG